MLKVFLGFGFPEGRPLAEKVEALLESHDVRAVTGEYLEGQALTPAVMSLVDESDGLVALLMRRARIQGGEYTSSQWVQSELTYARAKQKPAIAIVDERVRLETGLFQEHERIVYRQRDPLPAFLKLSQTISQWKRRTGRRIPVRILPEPLGRRLASSENGSCASRLTHEGNAGAWEECPVIRMVGGIFAYVAGTQEDSLIQLRVTINNETWISPATPQWMHVTLTKER